MKNKLALGTSGILALCLCLCVACGPTGDAGVTASVKTKMAADPDVSALQIEVDTQNGVVTLTGNVNSATEKEQAIRIARDTSGVRDVVDMITVRVAEDRGDAPGTDRTIGERLDDASITMKVKDQLRDDPMVKARNIDVDTRDGVVFLTGTVATAEEKERAIELARNTQDVRDVQANLDVRG